MTYYRNGEHNARNLYREPGDHDHIGCMFTEEDGRLAAAALNFHHRYVSGAALRADEPSARSVIAGRLEVMLDGTRDPQACAATILNDLLHNGYIVSPVDDNTAEEP